MRGHKRGERTRKSEENDHETGGNGSSTSTLNSVIPFESQNAMEAKKIIMVFQQQFKHILESSLLQEFIQVVKGELYDRNYLGAFDNNDKRFAYASRWSPARALGYSSLFGTLAPIMELMEEPQREKRVLCVGGGAGAELVGLASVFCRLKEYHSNSPSKLIMDIVDIADWTPVITGLSNYIQHNWVYKPESIESRFSHNDILDNSFGNYSEYDLITLLFTTNELFTQRKTESVHFLKRLNQQCKSGCYLLIVESAGSYSHINIGSKTFPIQFVIDTVLIGNPQQNNGCWELVDESDSCWYRITENIEYSMKLENMRFFYRLYRRRGTREEGT